MTDTTTYLVTGSTPRPGIPVVLGVRDVHVQGSATEAEFLAAVEAAERNPRCLVSRFGNGGVYIVDLDTDTTVSYTPHIGEEAAAVLDLAFTANGRPVDEIARRMREG